MPLADRSAERSIAIIDLANLPDGLQPPLFCQDAEIRFVLLVDPQGAITFPWLEFARSDAVESVLGILPQGPEPYAPLATVLARLDGRLSQERLATLVLARNPQLAGVEDLVRPVLAYPWSLRRPRDLAASLRTPEPVLLRRCEAVGLTRVEHLLTLVRWLGFQVLITEEGLAIRRARLIVGISDPSNFRRQLRRLAYFERSALG
jgi:hypothetical protein